jgi:hypothetical protein
VTRVEIIGLVAVCLLFATALWLWLIVIFRQRRMVMTPGALPVALADGDRPWSNGVGRYEGDELVWYRTLSLSPIAAVRLDRRQITVTGTRAWNANEDRALRPNLRIVELTSAGRTVRLGFPDDGLTGFLSWLESSAPRF